VLSTVYIQELRIVLAHGPITAGSPLPLFYLRADPASEELCVFQPERADYAQNFGHDKGLKMSKHGLLEPEIYWILEPDSYWLLKLDCYL
jgi:hypothetical protein